MNKQYRSNIMAAVHETAEDLHEVGLMDKCTMREFDELCLTPIRPLVPDEIHKIRKRENVSQRVFANYLNVSKGIMVNGSVEKKDHLELLLNYYR